MATSIGITGANGFLGAHLRLYLKAVHNIEAHCATRETFSDQAALSSFTAQSEIIIHTACKIRGEESDILKENRALSDSLIAACASPKTIVFVSSSQATDTTLTNAYAVSKREEEEYLRNWAQASGHRFRVVYLPHLFGEGGRADHNAVTHTFCHRLANCNQLEVTGNSQLSLCHGQDAAEMIVDIALDDNAPDILPVYGTPISVADLANLLTEIDENYQKYGIIPNCNDPFILRLFNTYRSYLFPEFYPHNVTVHSDDRGDLFEALKSKNQGQVFVSTTKPGITRGNHFHRFKIERFCVLKGQADVTFRHVLSSEITTLKLSGDTPSFIDIPTGFTHAITNTGQDELLTLFWAHEFYDPDHSDTYSLEV